MQRLCFFSGDITRSGGTEKVSCQIMNGLADEYKIFVISLTESGEMFYQLDKRISHIGMYRTNQNGIKQYIGIVNKLRGFIRKNKIDVLIDIDTMLDMFSVPALIGLKTKLIAWEHFNFNVTIGNKLRVPIRKYITPYADCVVTLTKEDQSEYIKNIGKKCRIEQIYNPIDIKISEDKYDINSNTIISAGRLSSQKGFDMLVDVAAIVLKEYPNWEWIILGEGNYRGFLEKKINEKNLNNLKLIGRVENVAEYMKHSAIYVMTSRYEGFPLVLIEAKANKLPIVTFNCKTGPAELVQEDINGNLIECFDIVSMADKIMALIEDKNKRLLFSDSALLDTEKMKYEDIIGKWKKLLRTIML